MEQIDTCIKVLSYMDFVAPGRKNHKAYTKGFRTIRNPFCSMKRLMLSPLICRRTVPKMMSGV